MTKFYLIASILAMICTAGTTLMMITLCLMGGANSSPEQIRTIKWLLVGIPLLGIAGIVIGILLLKADQSGWSLVASISPTVIMVGTFMVALIK